jgi:hypothetical protein
VSIKVGGAGGKQNVEERQQRRASLGDVFVHTRLGKNVNLILKDSKRGVLRHRKQFDGRTDESESEMFEEQFEYSWGGLRKDKPSPKAKFKNKIPHAMNRIKKAEKRHLVAPQTKYINPTPNAPKLFGKQIVKRNIALDEKSAKEAANARSQRKNSRFDLLNTCFNNEPKMESVLQNLAKARKTQQCRQQFPPQRRIPRPAQR